MFKDEKAMYRLAVLLGCLIFTFFVRAHDPAGVARKIEAYRHEQRYATAKQHEWYEQRIEQLKKEQGVMSAVHVPVTWQERVHHVMCYIPFIVFQVLFLIMLLLMLWFSTISWWSTLALIALAIVLYGEYDVRNQHINVVAVPELFLYVGPGTNYPVQKKLSYLDEVVLLNSKYSSLFPQWRYVQYQNIKGWMLYDNTFN